VTTLRLGGKCLGTQNSRTAGAVAALRKDLLSHGGVGGGGGEFKGKKKERGV